MKEILGANQSGVNQNRAETQQKQHGKKREETNLVIKIDALSGVSARVEPTCL